MKLTIYQYPSTRFPTWTTPSSSSTSMRALRCLSATSRVKMASLSCPRFVNFDSAIDQKLILQSRAWLS